MWEDHNRNERERESAWEWGRPAARKDGPAKGGDGWVDGWMGMETDGGNQHEEEGSSSRDEARPGEEGQAKPPRGRGGWDGMGRSG